MAIERGDLNAALVTYEAISDASPLPISVLDRAGLIRLWNPAAERVLGWRACEVIGKPLPSIPETERAAFDEQFRQALEGEIVTGREGSCRRKDGVLLDVRIAAAPIRNTDGDIVGVVRTLEDVSDQKRAENALRAQAGLLDLTFDAILVRDFATDQIAFWNRGAEALYGYTRDEAVGRVSHDLLQTLHPIPIEQAKEILVSTGRWEGELTHTSRDGARLIVQSRWALQSGGGRPVAILETNTDITDRKAAENALRESEERYRTIVATANEGIWLIGSDARTIYANDRMAEMLGYTPEELAARSVLACLCPGDEPLAQERIGQNLQGNVEQFDFRFQRKDGSELLVLGCTSPVRDAEGNIVGALGMFTDITDRVRGERERLLLLGSEQRARAAVEDSERRLGFLADASDVLASSLDYETTLSTVARLAVEAIADWCAVHVVDEEGQVREIAVMHLDPARIELVRTLQQRYPYDPNAATGVPRVLRTGESEMVSEITDEMLEAADLDADTLELVRDLGFTSSMIVPLVARGHTLGAITFVAAESGRHYGQADLALAQDLARRAALAVDNARLYQDAERVGAERSAILAQMADGIILCDTAGTVTFMNDAAVSLYGANFTGASLAAYGGNISLRDSQGERYTVETLPIFRALARGESTIDAEATIVRSDGGEVIVRRSVTPVTAPDGTRIGAVLTVRDVTAQRTLEQQKDDFLAAAAHDLKTPLTSLKGTVQLLQRRIAQRRVTEPVELLDGLGRIEQSATRMTFLINELVDLTRLQMGGALDLNRRETDLVSLVGRYVDTYRHAAGGDRVEVQTELSELVGIWDADRLERVVSNLLDNAIKYGGDNAPIVVTIRADRRGETDHAVVSVRDHGIGIPAEDVPHIFDRFYRGRNVTPDSMGTGIGLAGVKQIVEQHGGTIELETEEGRGSTFTISLPLQ